MDINQAEEVKALLMNALEWFGLNSEVNSWMYVAAAICALLVIASLGLLLARFLLHFKLIRLINLTKNQWDDELLNSGVFNRAAHLVPALILYTGKFLFFEVDSTVFKIFSVLVSIYLITTFLLVLHALLSAIDSIYAKSSLSKRAPITGFIQVARLIITLAYIFLLISILLGKSPVYLLSGLTAVAAVMLLIFRDTILGFVAGIQIAANRMFNTGDWVQLSKYGIDGDIIEIGLTVVKIQNWDKTISTIPTYALTSDSVKNWRGMQASGGRRIKRSIHIDMRSIGFATQEQITNWKKFSNLSQYIEAKLTELEDDMARCDKDKIDPINSRKLTNIGTFRAYARAYIKSHPDVHPDMTCMVRQLAPSETGLPIEIYCFSKKQDWVDYEHVQAEIFDHLLAILPQFSLHSFQRVTNNRPRTSPRN